VVVGGLAALAVAATIASLRGDADTPVRERPPPQPTPAEGPLVARLGAAGVRGTLYASDPNDDCRLRALALPELRTVPAPPTRSCRFELSPDGSVSLGEAVWSPNGRQAARVRRGRVEVLSRGGELLYDVAGSATAWRPDGALTIAVGGAVRGFRVPCVLGPRRCGFQVLGREAVRRAADAAFFRRDEPVVVTALAWLGQTRVLLVLASRPGGGGAVAVFERGRLARLPRLFGRFDRLRVSPRRRFVALSTRSATGEPAVWLVDRAGRLVATQFGSPVTRALAWSPDERWTAVATRASVFVLPTDELELLRAGRQPPTIPLPVPARDLAWTG
jgi:hypothetical protein